MKPLPVALAALFFASQVSAAVIHSAGPDLLVAESGSIVSFDRAGVRRWRATGVASPTSMASGTTLGAACDALDGDVTLFELANGRGSTVRIGGGPTEALFVGADLYVLSADTGELHRIRNGRRDATVAVGRQPAFLRQAGDRLIVYSRIDGTVRTFSVDLRPDKTLQLDGGGSDLETDGSYGYLALPKSAAVVTFSIETMRVEERLAIGAVPVDLAIEGKRTPLTAARLLVADPSAKKVWRTEGSQSFAGAVARGALRGAIGLGLYTPRSAEFPTGVDRIANAGGKTIAFDSSKGDLFLVDGKKSRRIAAGVRWEELAITSDGIFGWDRLLSAPRRLDLP
jgi:hypothetical protein